MQAAGQYGGAASYDSTLSKLLPAWGIDFSTKKMIADPVFATQVQRDADVQSDPTILSITSEGINKEDTLGAAVSDLLMPFAGAFIGKPAEGLKEDVLVKSSTQAGLVDTALLQAGGDAIRKGLKSANTAYPIAIRLSGKFKTAFPDGKPENKSAAEPSLVRRLRPQQRRLSSKKPKRREWSFWSVILISPTTRSPVGLSRSWPKWSLSPLTAT